MNLSALTGTSPLHGLTTEESRHRMQQYGENEVSTVQGRSVFKIIRETLREPMFLLLTGAAALYMFVGDFAEGLFLLGGAGATIGLAIFQEAFSERALAALRELSHPHVRVLRDGAESRNPVRRLVPGDIMLVGEGERLPADGLLVAGDVLSVDQSVLTGKSSHVSKSPAQDTFEVDDDVSPGERPGLFVFAGTLIVRGQGVIRTTRTGTRSALGRIGSSLAQIEQERTPLQKTPGKLVGQLGLLALAFCALIAVMYGLMRDDWLGGALALVFVLEPLASIFAVVPPDPYLLALAVGVGIVSGGWTAARAVGPRIKSHLPRELVT